MLAVDIVRDESFVITHTRFHRVLQKHGHLLLHRLLKIVGLDGLQPFDRLLEVSDQGCSFVQKCLLALGYHSWSAVLVHQVDTYCQQKQNDG